MRNGEYLSDEELENLIDEIESSETISAPPDILTDILRLIHEPGKEQNPHISPVPEKKWFAELFRPPEKGTRQEFRIYCIRVAFCSAAVIALLFFSPRLPEFPQKEVPPRSRILAAQKIRTREEVLRDRSPDISSEIEEKIIWITQLFD